MPFFFFSLNTISNGYSLFSNARGRDGLQFVAVSGAKLLRESLKARERKQDGDERYEEGQISGERRERPLWEMKEKKKIDGQLIWELEGGQMASQGDEIPFSMER